MALLSTSLTSRNGFHTTFSSEITVHNPADIEDCSLHILHILPPRIFVDPYELANYNNFYTFKIWGTSNLELPVTVVGSEGSAVLLDVVLSKTLESGQRTLVVDVPLHVRYGSLDQPVALEVPGPTCFWACPLSCKF